MSDTGTIADRIKQRVKEEARHGRIGGTEHKKLVAKRIKEVEARKKNKNRKVEC